MIDSTKIITYREHVISPEYDKRGVIDGVNIHDADGKIVASHTIVLKGVRAVIEKAKHTIDERIDGVKLTVEEQTLNDEWEAQVAKAHTE